MLRRLSALFLACLLLLPAAGRKRVAVVLSGGGAKGMAHIGALKVIESAGLPVDIVVGTSMGALIGGLYSIGYTPWQLDSMVRCQDWNVLLSDRPDRRVQSIDARERSARYLVSVPLRKRLKESVLGGMIRGDNLAELFSTLLPGYNDSISFDSLPTRFACVAADIRTSREVVFRSGHLYTAMRASMAIPGVFTPVRLDSMVLVDGGLRNNFPVDVARAMGADVVIGVTVQDAVPKSPEELVTLPEILNQAVNVATRVKYDENVAQTDVLIRVPVDGYGSASFNPTDIDSLIARGERAAIAQTDSLLALRRRAGLDTCGTGPARRHVDPISPEEKIHVTRVVFADIKKGDARMARRKCGLRDSSDISLAQIEQALNEGNDTQETYKNEGDMRKNRLFTTICLMAAILFTACTQDELVEQGTALPDGEYPLQIGCVSLTAEPTPMRRISLSYDYLHNELNANRNGRRMFNTSYDSHRLGLEISDAWFRNVRYAVGARFEYFHFKDFLSESAAYTLDGRDPYFINYYARFDYDSFDRDYYPTRGGHAELGLTAYTDNFINFRSETPAAAVHGSVEVAIPLNSRLTLVPAVAGRALLGEVLPFFYSNTFGYPTGGRYLDQQQAFCGLYATELAERYFGTIRLRLQQRIGRRHYVSVAGSYGMSSNELIKIFNSRQLAGIGLTYGYDSFIGPLEASLGYFNKSNKVALYINLGIPF